MESPLLFDLTAKDLYQLDGLKRVHRLFLKYLQDADPQRYSKLLEYYENPRTITDHDDLYQNFCVEFGEHVEKFIAYLFNIQEHIQLNGGRQKAFENVLKVRKNFIERFALKNKDNLPNKEPILEIKYTQNFDLDFTQLIYPYLSQLHEPNEKIKHYKNYALWAIYTKEGKQKHKNSILFNPTVKKTVIENFLENITSHNTNGLKVNHEPEDNKKLSSFSCTDHGISFQKSLQQTNYCIKCHPRKKDSCKTGLFKNDEKVHDGCPLDEKISAFMILKEQGHLIGALATICIDNPMVAATGHRICNDCRLSCIYQKQESVDVPGVESSVLQDVLNFPYGFEIYSLLTRWNPLNLEAPLPLPPTGHSVLVVGQGPSGFSLAHHLMHKGIQVVAIDGNKIEPLTKKLKSTKHLIKNIAHYLSDLDDRIIMGFGGVAEYGITLRWNKNNLTIIRFILEKNALYNLYGGIHFGSNITETQAYEMGFDHIALCMGARKPQFLQTTKKLPKGVRLASDFLMSLQLAGAFKKDVFSDLTIDMPIAVIGGGLTAIDTATEAQRYYIRQIEKVEQFVKALKEKNVFEGVVKSLNEEEYSKLHCWLNHAKMLADEKEKAHIEKRQPNLINLLHQFGGTTVIYRKKITDAPSVRLNVDEVQKAMEEGIFFKEESTPLDFTVDKHGQLQEIVYLDKIYTQQTFPAKTAIIAIGTQPLQYKTKS